MRVCGEGGCEEWLRGLRGKPNTLRHFESWAEHVILDTGLPWELEGFHRVFLKDLFQGFRETWLLIAEGNTKTTTLAGVGLYHIQFNRRGRVPVAAASRDQAFEMYLQAQAMAEDSVALTPVFTCHEGLREIKCRSQKSRVQIRAADDRTGDGGIFTLALIDELHRHRDLRLYRTWVGKTQKRGGQVAGISTAGEPNSEFELTREKMRQAATKVTRKPGYLRAESEDSVLHEYALPEGADLNDIEKVKLANPFSKITVEMLRSKRNLPTMTVSHWARMTCNIAARGSSAAVSEIEWEECATHERIPDGETIWAGLDVAWKIDTTALVPFWPRDPEFRLLGPAKILTPPRDGTMLPQSEIEVALSELNDVTPIEVLVMDMSKAEGLAQWAESNLGCQVVDRIQTNPMAALDYERWMEAMRHRHLRHCGDPALNKHVFNAIARSLPGGTTRFDRPAQSRRGTEVEQELRVVDALTAASMVHSVWAAELDVEVEDYATAAGFAWG